MATKQGAHINEHFFEQAGLKESDWILWTKQNWKDVSRVLAEKVTGKIHIVVGSNPDSASDLVTVEWPVLATRKSSLDIHWHSVARGAFDAVEVQHPLLQG